MSDGPWDPWAPGSGFGQTCQQAADGPRCQCAMGACGSDGNCAFFNPFDPFASQPEARCFSVLQSSFFFYGFFSDRMILF